MENLPVLDPAFIHYQMKDKEITIFPVIHDDLGFAIRGSQLLDDNYKNILLEVPGELESIFQLAIERLPAFSFIHEESIKEFKGETRGYVIHPGDATYNLAYSARLGNIPIEFIDTINVGKQIGLEFNYYHIASLGWEQFWILGDQLLKNHVKSGHLERTMNILYHILENNECLVVVGALHWPFIHEYLVRIGFTCDVILQKPPVSIEPRKLSMNKLEDWYISDVDPKTIYLSTRNIPFLIALHISNLMESKFTDVIDTIKILYLRAEEVYEKKFIEKVPLRNKIQLFKYLRNLSRIHLEVIPSLIDLVQAGIGLVDGDYGHEVFRIAVSYPFVANSQLNRTVKFTASKQGKLHRMIFKRRYKRKILQISDDEYLEFDPLPSEDFPGQWLEIWEKYSKDGYVSYPPEDIYLEKYLRMLERKLSDILRDEESSIMKFETSMEDGIDWKATILNYQDHEIYVKKLPQLVERIGSIVLQFEEHPDPNIYNHYTTLFAEHNKESHLSVITSEIGKEFVGPGICRVRFAALISQYPPEGIPQRILINSDELKIRLIYTAMSMSLSRIIGFIGPKPPTSAQKEFATQYGFRLLYLPIVNLSKQAMHRLRTLHLLANKSFREIAREYIGF